ncbi:MAG: alcohol dehydrogenase catalytic domain-containing protein [Sporomusaceae bacterium]|nr:alcohol dehydrogenase catalytic domain-containing protein [Sporomusaceae bacterium]
MQREKRLECRVEMSKTLELYLEKPEQLVIREAAFCPEPKANEVILQVIYGGICGSDIRVYRGLISYAKYPLRPGHEVLGRIVKAGSLVPLQPGTRAVVFPNTYCGECEYCLEGNTNICAGKQPLGVSCDGVFAQMIAVDAKYVVAVPENMPDSRAILIEPFAVIVHALKKACIRPGSRIGIIGCGTEGLLSVSLALHLGAAVSVVDINPVKLQLARQFGPVTTFTPESVQGQLFDVVVEAAGVKASIEQSLQLVKPGGTMIALGITGDLVAVSPIHIVRSELSILGSIIYTKQDFADAIAYLGDSDFRIEPVISKIVPFTSCQEAFADAVSGNFAKLILDFRN